jgi:phosphoribosylaminoimidazole-succinocarboxamide synthase
MNTQKFEIGELLHRGSVKDIYKVHSQEDVLTFKFSDRYSVFDWGEMPDALEGKGRALASMGLAFFQFLGSPKNWKNWQGRQNLSGPEESAYKKLCQKGLSHHCLGQLQEGDNSLVVKKVEVPSLSYQNGVYDYAFYQKRPIHALVPLEVIFRFGVPEGSSLIERVGDSDYRRVLGLSNIPEVGQWLSKPIIEYSTKLENTDRYLTYETAQEISGLSDQEFASLHGQTMVLALRLFDFFKEHEIELWDGKVEWAFGHEGEKGREFILVDSIGPDELRLSYNGFKLSKEFLRSFYRQDSWLEHVKKAKERAKSLGQKEWKSFVRESYGEPPHLNASYLQAGILLYQTLDKIITQKNCDSSELHATWQKLTEKMKAAIEDFATKNTSEKSQEVNP